MASVGWLWSALERLRSSDIRRERGVKLLPLLCIERSQLRWFGHLMRMPPGRLPLEVFRACVQLGGDPGLDPELTEGITYPMWPGKALGCPRRSRKALLGRGMSGVPYLACCHRDLTADKRKIIYLPCSNVPLLSVKFGSL